MGKLIEMEIKISTNDLVGKIFIKLQSFDTNLQTFPTNEYFEVVKKLGPLVDEVDEQLTGFYISAIGLPYNGPPRITCSPKEIPAPV
ncbi:MAG: hypothetical protein ACE5J5_05500 [Candidatus Hydrothermarchaeales archaeon]